MRSFAAISPSVWQTDIKKLRGDPEAVSVYFHLLTSPHSTMIGIYPLDLNYVAIDLGSPLEGASKGLRRVCEAGLASYDEANEIVWIHDMALAQVAPRLSPKDNKVSAVAKHLSMLPICPITLAFYQRFRELYHLWDLPIMEDFERAFRSPFEAPSEPLRSKEKDKDQNQDLGKDQNKFRSEDSELGAAHAREAEREDPFDPPAGLQEGRDFLVRKGVPAEFMEAALQRLMRGALFPCDIDNWKREARERRGAA